jgi:hypothetical protein
MLTQAEWLTSIISSAVVVTLTVTLTTTMYLPDSASFNTANSLSGESNFRYELSDAYFTCRDQINKAIPYKVRNINIDSHSSRHEENNNSHLVYIDLEITDRTGSFYSKYTYDAKILCRVSAASNEVTEFKVSRS